VLFSDIFSDFYAYIYTNISEFFTLNGNGDTRPKHIALIRHLRGIGQAFHSSFFFLHRTPFG
jgi:hypothetical protein